MAEYLTATRPDGKTVTVSRKLFDRTYRALGFREGEVVGDVPALPAQGEVVSTHVEPGDDPKLTPEVIANGPDDPDEDAKPKRQRKARSTRNA